MPFSPNPTSSINQIQGQTSLLQVVYGAIAAVVVVTVVVIALLLIIKSKRAKNVSE